MNTYASVGQRTNTSLGRGPKRGEFALSGGRFPLNTPGRVAAAPGMAGRSLKAGNISAAQAAHVRAAAGRKRGIVNSAR